MAFRESMGLPPRMSLHRYWMHANRMRQYFEAALIKQPPNIEKHKEIQKAMLAAVTFVATDPGIFMSYWYGSLYVVIEGWKQLRLSDSKIDPLIASPNVGRLKKYRDGVFHFQRNYFDDRFAGFMTSKDSVQWVREIHAELGDYFLRESASGQEQMQDPT